MNLKSTSKFLSLILNFLTVYHSKYENLRNPMEFR